MQALENVSVNLATNVQDYLVNVDISKAQFNVDMLFEEAGRLGMDFGDLQEYGVEVKRSVCGSAKACITKNSFKNFDDAFNKGNKFSNKFFTEAADLYERAQCHEGFRNKVTPKVQGLWSTCPLWCFTFPWFYAIEIPNYIFCCPCECVYRCCF